MIYTIELNKFNHDQRKVLFQAFMTRPEIPFHRLADPHLSAETMKTAFTLMENGELSEDGIDAIINAAM